MKIGIMDSGIGGLTVLKEAIRQAPHHEYIYFADSQNAPYGKKTVAQVRDLTEAAVRFLMEQGAQIIVLACNTATSAAAAYLREKIAIPIIGMEPAIKPAVLAAEGKKVLATATHLTLASPKFQQLVAHLGNTSQIETCPLTELVTFAEAGNFADEVVENYLTTQLNAFDLHEFGAVVLGCTHFPLFLTQFQKVLPEHIKILDGGAGTVKRMKEFITSESQQFELVLFVSKVPLINGERYELIQHILNI